MAALALAVVSGVPPLVFALYLDRREPEPWWLLAILFLWGAVVATALAVLLQEFGTQRFVNRFNDTAAIVDTSQLGIQIVDINSLFSWLETSLIAPFTEEAVKGIAVVLVFVLLPTEVNTLRDGVIAGALVGIGFAVTETTTYIISGYAVGGANSFLSQLIPRIAILGANGHIVFTALFGAGLGWARESNRYGWFRKGAIIVGTFLLALGAHSMFNAFGPFSVAGLASLLGWGPTVTVGQLWLLSALGVLSTYGWAYVVMAYFLVESGFRELKVIRTELRLEVPTSVTPRELSLVEGEGLWKVRRLPGLSRRQSNRLVRAQNKLAFERDSVRRAGGEVDDHPLVMKWRQRIKVIRADIVTNREHSEP